MNTMKIVAVSNRRELPVVVKEISAVLTITCREIITAIKSPDRLFMALVWPIMIFGVMGSGLAENMGMGTGYNFSEFMMVGMSVNAFFMMTIQGITSLIEDRENDFTQEIFVTPVSRFSILLGKTIGASFAGYVQFFVTILIALLIGVHLDAAKILTLLAISPLMCLVSGSLGVLLVGFVHSSSAMNSATVIVSMLQMLLSGAMFPISHSTGVYNIIMHLIPMTYAVDFARGVFYASTPAYNSFVLYRPAFDLIIMIAFTTVFFILGTARFVRSEKNR